MKLCILESRRYGSKARQNYLDEACLSRRDGDWESGQEGNTICFELCMKNNVQFHVVEHRSVVAT